ncbi:MAG: 50S ribosomal protein L25 [Patescibacteria group bacterium]
MTTYSLAARLRDTANQNLTTLRNDAQIPGVVYGNDKKNINISVDKKEFNRVLSQAGETSIIELTVDGEKTPRNVLTHDLQLHPISDDTLHIDFFEVNMTEEIETEVPLKFVGESAAVENEDGTLITNKSEITVKCLPGNIPHEIEVDLTKLATFEDSITVADLVMPTGVKLITDPEETIAIVNPPRSEEELAGLDEKVEENVEAVADAVEKDKEEEEPAAE